MEGELAMAVRHRRKNCMLPANVCSKPWKHGVKQVGAGPFPWGDFIFWMLMAVLVCGGLLNLLYGLEGKA